VVYLPYDGGGAVFSVGSCSWCGSLSHNSYRNDIYRITDNVLSAFSDGRHATSELKVPGTVRNRHADQVEPPQVG
jgi:N,N-dimethylformamidase